VKNNVAMLFSTLGVSTYLDVNQLAVSKVT